MLRNLIKLQADLKCWYEVLFPLLSSQKFCLSEFWLLFRMNKKLFCSCVCVLTKTVSILIIYTRCVLRLIRYYILLQFFMHNILYWQFYTIFLHQDGQFLLGFRGIQLKKVFKNILYQSSQHFFLREKQWILPKTACAKILRWQWFSLKFLPVYYLYTVL